MALYIFYVDAGQRLALNDEYLFGGTVADLKSAIERHVHVHSRNQVVFVSVLKYFPMTGNQLFIGERWAFTEG